ncbi:MAG: hypothetical protein HZA53_09275 [Planctomycetes bacterium]|nr:hypothetical protein [Planctomycetota bacterium]
MNSTRITPRFILHAVALATLLFGGGPVRGQCGVPASIGGGGGQSSGVDVEDGFAFAVEHARLSSFDLSDPARPRAVGTLLLSGNFLWDVKVENGIAVCADAFWGVRIADVHDPSAPFYLATWDTPYAPESVAIANGIVYAADGQSSVQVVDVHDPRTPFLRAAIPIAHPGLSWYAQEVVVVGSTLYVGSEAYGQVALDIVDVANPSVPILRGSIVFAPGYPVGLSDLDVDGATAYVTESSTGLHIVDVSNPAAPVQVGSLSGAAGVVRCYGTRLLLGRGPTPSLDVVDVSNPALPVVLGNLAVPGGDDIAIAGDKAVIALGAAGLGMLDLANPNLPVLLGTSAAPGDANDVVVVNGLGYVADGSFGVKVMDLANPMLPVTLGAVDTPGVATGLFLDGPIAYVADGSAGLRIVDVGNSSAPTLLGAYDTPGNAVEVAVASGRAYVADGTQGLRIVDVSNPLAPVPLGGLVFPGVNSQATAVFVAGTRAYVADRSYGLRIVDVSNPVAPVLLSTTGTYSTAWDVVVDGTLAYVADYSKRVFVIDVANPSAPVVLYSGSANNSAKKLALAGNRLYVAQNQGGWVATFDVTNPSAPVLLPSTVAPTLGNGIAYWNGFLVSAHANYGLRTFRADGLPFVAGPADTTAASGANASLSVAAAGQTVSGAQALACAWRRNGVGLVDGPTGNGSMLGGSSTPLLTITNAALADGGTYDCVVSSACGATASSVATLTILPGETGQGFCAGDALDPQVTTPCPCGNVGTSGRGCAHSANAAGARLFAQGTTTPDTIVLRAEGLPATTTCIFLAGDGDNVVGVVFGDGVRCVDGLLVRLGTNAASAGSARYPSGAQASVSVRGGTPPGSGLIGRYQTYYRNAAAAFCPPATFNVTNGWSLAW